MTTRARSRPFRSVAVGWRSVAFGRAAERQTVPMGARVYLVDGTMELFRCFHGAPRASHGDGREVGAVRALFATLASLVQQPDVTHVAVALDSVVPPPGRPSGSSPDDLIASQVGLAAEVVRALGVVVWPSGRYQADELLATGAAKFADDPRVDQVVICSNDKDFHQCVRAERGPSPSTGSARSSPTSPQWSPGTGWRRARSPSCSH